MFIYKTSKEVNEMTDEQLDTYQKELKAHEAELRKAEIENSAEATKTELKAEIQKAVDATKALEVLIKEVKDNQVEKANTNAPTLKSLLESKKDELSAMKDKSGASVNFTVKAAGTMAISTNTTGQIPQAEREAGITRVVRRRPYLLNLVNVGSIMSNLWEWVQQTNPDGGAGMTAEGASKTQADFDLAVASAPVKKVTSFIKVTKEMLDDVDLMASEIDQELTELINLKIDEQILSGSGSGANLTGITTNATAWAAGAFAGAVPSPTNADVLRTAINQVRVAQFEPNYIVMHPTDITKMELVKDSNGQYVLPPFTSVDGTVVSGIPVIGNTGMTIDKFLVGDFTKSGVRFKEGLTINVGYENDDFTKNLVTILAEARLVHRVKSNHYGAFVYGDFSDAITALKPA